MYNKTIISFKYGDANVSITTSNHHLINDMMENNGTDWFGDFSINDKDYQCQILWNSNIITILDKDGTDIIDRISDFSINYTSQQVNTEDLHKYTIDYEVLSDEMTSYKISLNTDIPCTIYLPTDDGWKLYKKSIDVNDLALKDYINIQFKNYHINGLRQIAEQLSQQKLPLDISRTDIIATILGHAFTLFSPEKYYSFPCQMNMRLDNKTDVVKIISL